MEIRTCNGSGGGSSSRRRSSRGPIVRVRVGDNQRLRVRSTLDERKASSPLLDKALFLLLDIAREQAAKKAVDISEKMCKWANSRANPGNRVELARLGRELAAGGRGHGGWLDVDHVRSQLDRE